MNLSWALWRRISCGLVSLYAADRQVLHCLLLSRRGMQVRVEDCWFLDWYLFLYSLYIVHQRTRLG
jgi:hypothetical protein